MSGLFKLNGYASEFQVGTSRSITIDTAGEVATVTVCNQAGQTVAIVGPMPPEDAEEVAREINLRSLASMVRHRIYTEAPCPN